MSPFKPPIAPVPGLLLALVLVVAVPGCNGSGTPQSVWHDPHPLPPDTMTFVADEIGHYGGRFVIGATAAPKTFNAIMANETSSSDVTQLLFVGLTEFDNGRQVDMPMLAKSWETSPDGRTWTFHMRRGAAFSDGHPITAEDVRFSFEVCYDEALHPSIQDLIETDGRPWEIATPDSYTVVFRLPRPYALAMSSIGSVRIMPKHVLEPAFRAGEFASAFGTNTPPESLVTGGAWRLKRFVPGEKIVLERNPYWFGVDRSGQRLPYLDELVFLFVPDQNTAALKFQAGDLDALDNVKPEDYKTYDDGQKAGHYTLHDIGPSLNTNFLWFNLNRVHDGSPGRRAGSPYAGAVKYAWFSDVRFRRAVSMAIDRDAIISSVFFGEAAKNWSLFTAANQQWHDPSITGPDFDPPGARRLLTEIGFRDANGDGMLEDANGQPVSFTLKLNADNVTRVAMANFIKDDLARVGVRCVPAPLAINTVLANLREDFEYDAMLLGLGAGVPPDPGMYQNALRSSGLTHYWHIKQPTPGTAAEAEIDRLISENVATIDVTARKATLRRILEIWNEQVFTVWLPSMNVKLPVRDGFGNIQPVALPHRILWNVDRVFRKHAPGPA